MKSQYLFQRNENYLVLVLTGEYDKDDFMSYPQLILEECAKENVNKVIVDALNLAKTDVPTMDRFFIAETTATLLRGRVRLAVLWPKNHINKFAETVGYNRGISMYVIDTMDAARAWLLRES